MHALASQGRLKDITRDVTHDYQRISHTFTMPQLSVDGDRTQCKAAEYNGELVDCRPMKGERTPSMLKDNRTAEASTTSDASSLPEPLQRLKQLETELASLNHARRRLAVDDDIGGDSGAPHRATEHYAATRVKTEPFNDQDDGGDQRIDNDHKDFRTPARMNDVHTPYWYSPSMHDTNAKRRQMCGGSMFSSTTSVITSCLQSYPLSASTNRRPIDLISSGVSCPGPRFRSDLAADESPLKRHCSPHANVRTTSDTGDVVENGRKDLLQSSTLQRTPGKQPTLLHPHYADVDSEQLPLQLQPQFNCEEESSGESHDGQDDIHVSGSNTTDREQMRSSLLSPYVSTGHENNSMTGGCGLKPSFWMTDYKHPKRCKKGNCTFQTVSKVEFWEHLSVHFTDDKLFRCDRCPFRTPLKHHMTSHRMNHDDDKPFSCDLCSYRAVSQSMVNSHKKSHSSVRPYVCDYPHCHYATKFVNQLTKHREKQHPGWVPSADGGGRRRRQSDDAPLAEMESWQRCYPDSLVGGLGPPVFPPLGPAGAPPLTTDAAARNAMLQWSMSACGWSPFNFLQRMAGVSSLPLCPPSPASLSAQRSVDVKPPYQSLPPSTLPPQLHDTLPGARGLSTTPRKPPPTLESQLHMLQNSLSGLTRVKPAAPDVDADVRRSLMSGPGAVTVPANTRVNVADDTETSSAPAVERVITSSSAADIAVPVTTLSTLTSASRSQRSDANDVAASLQTQSRLNANTYTNVSRASNADVDDHPLDLTAKPNVVEPSRKDLGEVFQSTETDASLRIKAEPVPSRKTSRRKGIAHKLDTTCNRWLPVDVKNEPFDLVPLPTSPQNGSTSLNEVEFSDSQQSSSTQASSSDPWVTGGAQSSGMNGTSTDNERQVPNSYTIENEENRTTTRVEHRQVDSGGGTEERSDTAVDFRRCPRLEDRADVARSCSVGGEECRHCGLVFKHPAMFDIHMGFHKFDDPWRCNRCGQRCSDCVDFNRHIATASHIGQV